MSLSWSGGSDRRWRAMRIRILNRDHWICQLCDEPIDPAIRPPDPRCAAPHHTLGRKISGDDPRFIVAAHLGCNLKAGDPTKTDPQPRPVNRW